MLIGAKYAVLLGLAVAGSYGSYELINKGAISKSTETVEGSSKQEQTPETPPNPTVESTVSDQEVTDAQSSQDSTLTTETIDNPGGGGGGAV